MVAKVLVAAGLIFLQWRSGAGSGVVAIAFIALFSYVTFSAGALLTRSADPSQQWVVGLLALCLAIYAMTGALPLTAGGALGVLAAVTIGLEIGLRRRPPRPEAKALIGFALAVALTAAWCYEPARADQVVRDTGVLPLWSDYFFQGGLISQFGDPRALGRGSIFLADYPPSFYHFGSYGAAAAFARVLDQPGLPLAAAVWLPLGFLAMLAGGYALGVRLAGHAGGIAALAALAIVPDASNYGLRNGWFSFHWTLFAHAGGFYALGAAFLSLALLDGSRRGLVASALLAASALLLRAHVFVLLLPAWVGAAAVFHLGKSRPRLGLWMFAVLAGGAAAASVLAGTLAEAGFWRIRAQSALVDFLLYVHTDHEPTAYTGVYESLRVMDQPALQLGAGIVLAFAAALGAFLLALPLATLVAWKSRRLEPIDAACAYLVFSWLLLMLFAPTPWHGDPSDLIHRPFVLVYGACAIWTLCLIVRLSPRHAWAAVLGLSMLALPAMVRIAPELARPKFNWSRFDAAVRVPPGLVEAADYLRTHSAPGEVFAAADLSVGYATFDLSTQLCSLSGVPAYLSRPYLEMIKDAPRKALVAARLRELEEVAQKSDFEQAMQALRALKLRWYVVAGDAGPRWDPARTRAAFRAPTLALYRTP